MILPRLRNAAFFVKTGGRFRAAERLAVLLICPAAARNRVAIWVKEPERSAGAREKQNKNKPA